MKNIILILFIIVSNSCLAQRKQNVYFLKNDGKEVSIRDSADFIRIISEPDSASNLYNLTEYYLNGNKKTVGTVSTFTPFVKYEGLIITYFINGNRKTVIDYKGNKPLGNWSEFYENGKLKESRIYTLASQPNRISNDYKVYQIADSLGNKFLDSLGSGKVAITYVNGNKIAGEYKNGNKDSIWTEYDAKIQMNYQEEYSNGKFISGEFTEASGKKGSYKMLEQLPEFKGGMQGLARYLSSSLKYPSEAKANGEQGRVMLNFIVNTDGRLEKIKVVRSVSSSLDEEAIRVVSNSPKWQPGLQKGQPVKVSYTLPIAFKL